jgi:hypothetical protein
MAFAWTHGGWRRETTAAAQRDKLILHIEEIENAIGGYERNQALDQMAARNLTALQEMLKRREEDLAALNDTLGLTPGAAADNPFVCVRPVE